VTTREQLNDTFDSMAAKAMRVKADRDRLLKACRLAEVILLQQKTYSETDREAMDVLSQAIAEVETR
jgi:hypothetical protein